MIALLRKDWRVAAAIFRMHDLQSARPAPRLAEAADPHAARQPSFLLGAEIKEPQRQKSGAIGDAAQKLAPAAVDRLAQQHFAFYRRALAGLQFTQRHDARTVLVAHRQQKQQVLDRLDSEGAEPLRERGADAAQRGDRSRCCHSATMHSASI